MNTWSDKLGRKYDVGFLNEFPEWSVQEIMRHAAALSPNERASILQKLEDLMSSKTVLPYEMRRKACKLAIGLLPDSAELLRHLITRRERKADYEIHFALFCWLDALLYPEMKLPETTIQFVQDVPDLVSQYLHSTQRNTGRAAWMAGDLLGDHWIPEQSLPMLLELVKSARYAVGREGSIHGLTKIARRVSDEERQQILETLKEVEKADRSESVRSSARFAMKSIQRDSSNLV